MGGEGVCQVPEEALKVAAYEDVHCGREGGFYGRGRGFVTVSGGGREGLHSSRGRRGNRESIFSVGPSGPKAVQDIIFICCDYEFGDGETHAFGEVAGENVAEVAGWDYEADSGRGRRGVGGVL